jgi:Fe-S cluster biogenesis protein NfuA
VADSGAFQEQVRKLGELVTRFDQMPDSPQKLACKELVQLLMDVHSQGLERMMEVILESHESGDALIERLGKDDVTGGLLLLYSLHPDALETRVLKAVEQLGSRLRKLSCAIELLSIEGAAVQVRLIAKSHSCGSSRKEMQAAIENGIYELAPEVTSLEIIDMEAPTSTGFVTLESLLAATPNGHVVQAGSAR